MYEGAPSNITGLLFAKDLVGIGFERELPLQSVLSSFPSAAKRVHRVLRSATLNTALDKCKKERVHLLVVLDDAGEHHGRDSADGSIGHLGNMRSDRDDSVCAELWQTPPRAGQLSNRVVGAAVGIATVRTCL